MAVGVVMAAGAGEAASASITAGLGSTVPEGTQVSGSTTVDPALAGPTTPVFIRRLFMATTLPLLSERHHSRLYSLRKMQRIGLTKGKDRSPACGTSARHHRAIIQRFRIVHPAGQKSPRCLPSRSLVIGIVASIPRDITLTLDNVRNLGSGRAHKAVHRLQPIE